jgi:pyruvate,water dikinase
MMKTVIHLEEITEKDRTRVGGKGYALAMMARRRLNVPDAVCLGTEAYRAYVASTGLRERILLELSRKDFREMRWEEMWDASLRIRNMFLRTPIPPDLLTTLSNPIEERFANKAVVVRSSAPGEDSAKASFAGLHESYVNVRGKESILEHVRLVWASLWSDAALLYRQELGLDVERSEMAVVIQEIAVGEQSGVAFGRNPNDPSQAVIEAVYGLNQGLVDGTVEPDRWILDRETGQQITHTTVERDKIIVPSPEGVRLEPCPPEQRTKPPLDDKKVARVLRLVLEVERLFGAPQDVEWTFKDNTLYVIQSRPITTRSAIDGDDKRSWYLSLRRSFDNLKALRQKIEKELIPAMVDEAGRMATHDLAALSDRDLAEEIQRRSRMYRRWIDVYWSEFIPFAHGARLFGQVYNDVIRPEDPYEFMDLLGATNMASLERNRLLEDMASLIREDPDLAGLLRRQGTAEDPRFNEALDTFIAKFGGFLSGPSDTTQSRRAIIPVLLEMATRPVTPAKQKPKDIEKLKKNFLAHFKGDQRDEASELLDLGRASYRLRDDDNIHLGRIEGHLQSALDEGKHRIDRREAIRGMELDEEEVVQTLKDPRYVPTRQKTIHENKSDPKVRARQLVGQPAGPGIARGPARVIENPSDLLAFRAGEILVCDAVDPNMTFVVPLSAAIVERRGGMLIHGAIIAREYGLPCVTGVPDAVSLIRTGDNLTVDGYLGIVIISQDTDAELADPV